MVSRLAERLQALRMEQLIGVAETILAWPESAERREEAARYLREAMFLCAVGKITQTEKTRLFNILAFALPAPGRLFDEPEA